MTSAFSASRSGQFEPPPSGFGAETQTSRGMPGPKARGPVPIWWLWQRFLAGSCPNLRDGSRLSAGVMTHLEALAR